MNHRSRFGIASLTSLLLLTLPLSTCTSDSPANRVDRLLGRLAEYGYSGTIAVAVEGGSTFEGAYGFSDAERRVPMTTDARFDIGSLTKPFTAALVLKLQEEGALSTGDSLGALLPDVPADKAGITIHELLTHSSGLVRSAVRLGVSGESTREEFLASVMGSDLLFTPGERFEYSDTGYDLLAAISERVTGRPWAELLRERILQPAGLRVTGYAGGTLEASDSVGPIAWSYAAPFAVPWQEDRKGPSSPSWYNRGSGGLVSTAGELRQWATALWDGKILSPASLEMMTSPQVVAGDGRSYGYGWFITETDHGRLVYHGGDIAGYKAHLAHYLEQGLIFAVLHSVYGWERVTDRYAIAAWFGEGPPLPPSPTGGSDIAEVGGTYRAGASVSVVWPEAGRLALQTTGQPLVGAVFAASGTEADERARDTEAVMAALDRGDISALQSLLRERDLAAGLGRRMMGIWASLAERFGPADDWTVLGSQPAQDGTVVSIVRIRRGQRTDLMRFIWRGGALVAVGGPEDLGGPTAVFMPVGPGRAARFEPATGRTSIITFDPLLDPDRLTIRLGDGEVDAVRDRDDVVMPPKRSLVRELMPVILQSGIEQGIRRYERLAANDAAWVETGEDALNSLGYALLRTDAVNPAVALFRYVTQVYPDSWNAWDSLGEAQLAAGDTLAGRRSYAQSLRLNPDNETAREIVGAANAPE